MAGTADNSSIPAGNWRPLLSELLEFVSKCLRSEVAARKFLLDHLADYGADWFFQAEIKSCESIVPGIGPFETMMAQGFAAIRRFFWRGREYIKMDWEASRASYFGPVIRTSSNPDNDRDSGPIFDGRWRVEIDVSLIRISAAPVIERLQFFGLLPPAIAGSPSLAPPPPVSARLAASEAPDQAKVDGTISAESTAAWVAKEASIMKSRGQIPETQAKLARELATRMKEAARTNRQLRAVGSGYIANNLRDWDLWPIEKIK